MGSGAHYLVADSVNGTALRNAGTTAINSTLAADLKKGTTYPPQVISANFAVNTTLSPAVARDTDTPDLGYHYPAADHAVNVSINPGVTLTVNPGTVLLAYGYAGLRPTAGSTLMMKGAANSPIVFARYESMHEQTNVWGSSSDYYHMILPNYDTFAGASATLSFVDFPTVGGVRMYPVYASTPGILFTSLNVSDCQFWAGAFRLECGTTATHALRNNLFFRNTQYYYGQATLSSYNNLFYRTWATFIQAGGSSAWTFKDNAFEVVAYGSTNFNNLTRSHNGFINCAVASLNGAGTGDKVINGTFNYDAGPFGNFYQQSTSTLINAGSRTADLAGLYHHTVKNEQTKEGNSTVDIGFHYVATTGSSSTAPVDTDGDGVPDYLEDLDGDGTVDAGETNWLDDLFKVVITEPKSNSNIP